MKQRSSSGTEAGTKAHRGPDDDDEDSRLLCVPHKLCHRTVRESHTLMKKSGRFMREGFEGGPPPHLMSQECTRFCSWSITSCSTRSLSTILRQAASH